MSTRRWPRYGLMVLVTALLVSLPGGTSRSAPATSRSTDLLRGDYKAEVRGALTGSGKVIVSAQHVHFNIAVQDEAGNQGTLHVKATLAADGRFRGSGQAMGRTVTLSGRLELADRTVKTGRLLCSFTHGGGGDFGRIVAQKEAAPPPPQGGGTAGGD